ncbi:hypothetical protein [Jatrophihabitans sp.]|jgi:hypothetical protein|uniref:hypothetical protein n=1 Tax=Jatrophihabitans sp. TaxID=1932789 RepID=UPI002F258CA2
MSIATDVRAYADLALEQGKNVLSQAGAMVSTTNKRLAADAPKPVFAALGVADLVAATVTKQADLVSKRVETLPADAAENVAKVQDTGRSLISKTQDEALARIAELRDRLDTGVGTVRALPALSVTAASITTVYLSNAKQVFGKLTARGETRLAELRNDSRVTRVLGNLDEGSSALQARLAPVLGSVRSEVVPYLDSAVDAIKEADLGEPASQQARTSGTGRRRTTGTRAASGTTSAAASGTATKRTAATDRGTSTGRTSTGRKSTGDTPATAATRKAGTRKASAAKTTGSAGKAPAAKATGTARKATATARKATGTARKATGNARKAPANKA